MNWHGKALGAKAEGALAAIMENIVNKEHHGITPTPPVEDAVPADISSIQLSQPPTYDIGQMVGTLITGKVSIDQFIKFMCLYMYQSY